jgi:hypothetical protein
MMSLLCFHQRLVGITAGSNNFQTVALMTETAINMIRSADSDLARSLDPSAELPGHTAYKDVGFRNHISNPKSGKGNETGIEATNLPFGSTHDALSNWLKAQPKPNAISGMDVDDLDDRFRGLLSDSGRHSLSSADKSITERRILESKSK